MRFSIILICLSIFLSIINLILDGGKSIYLISCALLLVSFTNHLRIKKNRNYRTYTELFKNEIGDMLILLAVLLFTAKFLVSEPLSVTLHLFSLGILLFAVAMNRRKDVSN